MPDPRPLKYAAACKTCGTALPRGTRAHWDREARAATCVGCAGDAVERGVAGGSAAREWERRHSKREARVRAQWGPLGGLALALSDDPQSTRAWAVGASGEQRLGAYLDRLPAEKVAVLHDRRIPGSRANIDHILVAPAGVFVVDAKHYAGRVACRDVGGFFHEDRRLFVGRRDCTKLVKAMPKQVAVVRAALGDDLQEAPIRGVVCFVAAEWTLFARPIRFDECDVVWADALRDKALAERCLTDEQIRLIERRLAAALPAA